MATTSELIQKQIDEIENLRSLPSSKNPSFEKWYQITKAILEKRLGEKKAKDFPSDFKFWPNHMGPWDDEELKESLLEGLASAEAYLSGLIEEIELLGSEQTFTWDSDISNNKVQVNQNVRKQYSKQLKYFQSQIPLGIQNSRIPVSTVEHYHQIVAELEQKSSENLSRFKIPDSVRWNDDSYITDGVRDRLGSLIGYLDSEIDEAREEGSADTLKIITGIQRTLRKLFRTKPASEKEIQDKLEDLFNAQELNFRREQEHIPYSSKTYIPDFTFDDINCVVEGKFCDSDKREKEMIAEINDDIQAYSTRYKNLIFVIYDLGFIRDESKFKQNIESKSVVIEIIKH